MRTALIILSLSYILSQFYRAFLAVLAPVLEADIGATAVDLSQASGVWFLVFALAQLPIGWALDTIGPRRTTAALFALGAGGGSLVFAMAQAPWHLTAAMALIGAGCGPILMASFYLIARNHKPVMFATLAGVVIAVGNLGNIGASLPLAFMVDAIGWRTTMLALGGICLVFSALIYLVIQDPKKVEGADTGSILDVLKIPALWLLFPFVVVNYAPAAGLRGLWIGPYFGDIFQANTTQIGQATLVMGVAMVLGSFAYGPMDRIFGTRKWVIFAGGCIGASLCFALTLVGTQSFWLTTLLFAGIGICGTSFPLIVALGRSFIPPHLTGRGVTLINLCGIGGVGLLQVASGSVFERTQMAQVATIDAYNAVFFLFGGMLVAGLAIFVFCKDRLD